MNFASTMSNFALNFSGTSAFGFWRKKDLNSLDNALRVMPYRRAISFLFCTPVSKKTMRCLLCLRLTSGRFHVVVLRHAKQKKRGIPAAVFPHLCIFFPHATQCFFSCNYTDLLYILSQNSRKHSIFQMFSTVETNTKVPLTLGLLLLKLERVGRKQPQKKKKKR